ncbi:uncharacterized protein [Nicotiana sylvestris]|uniref:Uncharacterized protein LOC104242678 n=1 Tax=Nicotiana sylvestris TaxID=4096 RepID=A0A1U7Y9Y2_NICSY|nr:PREDICTED: uncharacterized protein LOC104242678 [Nicotiana sylvestris]
MGMRACVPSQKALMAMSAATQAKFQVGTSAANGSNPEKLSSPNNSNATSTNVTLVNNVKGEETEQAQAMNVWNEAILNPRNEGQSKSPGNGRKSWADEVEKELGIEKRTSIWEEFDIAKLSNAGFKLEYVQPKLYGLDFKYWSPKGLSMIVSLAGRPLMVDQNTKKGRITVFKDASGSGVGC